MYRIFHNFRIQVHELNGPALVPEEWWNSHLCFLMAFGLDDGIGIMVIVGASPLEMSQKPRVVFLEMFQCQMTVFGCMIGYDDVSVHGCVF